MSAEETNHQESSVMSNSSTKDLLTETKLENEANKDIKEDKGASQIKKTFEVESNKQENRSELVKKQQITSYTIVDKFDGRKTTY